MKAGVVIVFVSIFVSVFVPAFVSVFVPVFVSVFVSVFVPVFVFTPANTVWKAAELKWRQGWVIPSFDVSPHYRDRAACNAVQCSLVIELAAVLVLAVLLYCLL